MVGTAQVRLCPTLRTGPGGALILQVVEGLSRQSVSVDPKAITRRHASIPWCRFNAVHGQAQFFPLCIVHRTMAFSHIANPVCESETFISFAKARLAAAGRLAMRAARRQPPQSRAS